MNYLCHMLLSGQDDHVLVGNFMGDFVKGPLAERFTPRLRSGVMLHRRIDSYAERHPLFLRSKHRLAAEYGLYRGIMIDLFYDYYLVNDWASWCAEPFGAYLARTRGVVERNRQSLPPAMHRLVPIIFEELLPSYGTAAGIGSALQRLSKRVKRANPLGGGEQELLRHHEGLLEDFQHFMPEISRFAGATLAAGLLEPIPGTM